MAKIVVIVPDLRERAKLVKLLQADGFTVKVATELQETTVQAVCVDSVDAVVTSCWIDADVFRRYGKRVAVLAADDYSDAYPGIPFIPINSRGSVVLKTMEDLLSKKSPPRTAPYE